MTLCQQGYQDTLHHTASTTTWAETSSRPGILHLAAAIGFISTRFIIPQSVPESHIHNSVAFSHWHDVYTHQGVAKPINTQYYEEHFKILSQKLHIEAQSTACDLTVKITTLTVNNSGVRFCASHVLFTEWMENVQTILGRKRAQTEVDHQTGEI